MTIREYWRNQMVLKQMAVLYAQQQWLTFSTSIGWVSYDAVCFL